MFGDTLLTEASLQTQALPWFCLLFLLTQKETNKSTTITSYLPISLLDSISFNPGARVTVGYESPGMVLRTNPRSSALLLSELSLQSLKSFFSDWGLMLPLQSMKQDNLFMKFQTFQTFRVMDIDLHLWDSESGVLKPDTNSWFHLAHSPTFPVPDFNIPLLFFPIGSLPYWFHWVCLLERVSSSLSMQRLSLHISHQKSSQDICLQRISSNLCHYVLQVFLQRPTLRSLFRC